MRCGGGIDEVWGSEIGEVSGGGVCEVWGGGPIGQTEGKNFPN